MLFDRTWDRSLPDGRQAKGPSPEPCKKNEADQIAFQAALPEHLKTLKANMDKANTERPVRLFCQDETRLGLMPVTRRRITACGTKPIQKVKPAYENFYLYGAVEPATGARFLMEHAHLNSDGFQLFLDAFAEHFPETRNVMILDNGSFHKAKNLDVPSNIRLVFLPPYAPELNPVERLWQDLKSHLAFHLFEKLPVLKQRVSDLLESYTDRAVASLCGYPYLLEAQHEQSS